MSGKRPVDLGAVRAARASLARLAETYPELRALTGPANRARWEETLAGILRDEGEGEETMPNDAQIIVRLPTPVLAAVDAYAAKRQRDEPGLSVSRSEAARLLIVRALSSEGIEIGAAVPRAKPAAKKPKRTKK